MHDLALMAAQQWASANTRKGVDSVQFGADVARVYLAAKVTAYHAGDEKATAAALAALSVPAETLQWFEQMCELFRDRPVAQLQEALLGTPGVEQ